MTGEAAARAPLTALKGVGSRVAERLQRLGIARIEDLLFHLPLRYEDRTRVVPIHQVRPGQQLLVAGEIRRAEVVGGGRARRLVCDLADDTGQLTLQFFNFYPSQAKRYRAGARVRCFGEVRGGGLMPVMIHPEVEFDDAAPAEEAGLTPVYPTTQGLAQATLRRLVAQAVDRVQAAGGLSELLPADLARELQLPGLNEALRYVHEPPADAPIDALVAGSHPACRRLALDELLGHHLSMRLLRQSLVSGAGAPRVSGAGALIERFRARLPFELTAAQTRVDAEIAEDLGAGSPMMRLVQGDVGSGKTVVAAMAALRLIEAGWQVAVMAPTELLSEQHLRNFRHWLEPLGLDVAWLSGRLPAAERQAVLDALAGGDAGLVVGTHALFQEQVRFAQLGLAIVDEQHRFGVHQRLALREKGSRNGLQPHQMIMTATPIPRTLAMTAYADLDVSVIDELPPGRQPVRTVVVPDSRREEVMTRIRDACASGRQAYWVCTLVDESEAVEARAAEATAAQLAQSLPELRVGLVHGRQRTADKEAAMRAFEAGETQLLVATTVIEVGVDVPNASLMIIENAERFGLAQLHQLRGRVGRGSAESSCVLLYRSPLSDTARARLAVMRETNDGFLIARRDLELRGPGELLGTRQTGALQYRVADLMRDRDLLEPIRRSADDFLRAHRPDAEALVARWVGHGVRYSQV
ncbi:ATP-dependent DNA helicase RecG [Ectothiorhodospiraceae bacterium WFHF3C12]|nr:ATP-dependent DNA helicase RecG [Ectothiorhodospiraceae bacterium WFHF3C12]